MDIVIAAQYLGDLEHPEGNNSRFLYLARMLKQRGHEVELLTSSFFHQQKRQWKEGIAIREFEGCPITILPEPGYPKNICLQRFYSHSVLALRMKQYLKMRKKPDVLYAVVPDLSVGQMLATYCKKQSVPFVIDVQDLWPESFKMVFHIPPFSDLIYAPFMRQANYIYRSADGIAAVSETFVQRAKSVNTKTDKTAAAFLGTELAYFDRMREETPALMKAPGEIWLGYIGTLGKSYDLEQVLEAMTLLKRAGKCSKLRFVVMGSGYKQENLEAYAQEKRLSVTFTGALPYPKMVSTLCHCDFAINPIRPGAASIINKVGDYAAAGLAVINTQVSREYIDLLKEYKAGITCENGSVKALADAIDVLYEDEIMRQNMGRNNRHLGEEKFDRSYSYEALCKLIEDVKPGEKD